ncbi:MAG: TIGR02117 family protein [Bacteroidetes bacterium]|nr:TIGR02117 family protein [Bacteroidota bacterium]
MDTLKTSLRYSFRFLLGLIFFVLLYLLFAWLLPFWKVNSSFAHAQDGIEIYVQSNGVHTDIIMPIHSKQMHWDEPLPFSDFKNVNSNYNYVAMGWGDKGFYLDTPTWNDLTFSTAFKAAFGLGTTAMHVTYKYRTPQLNESCKKIVVTEKQYQKLVTVILESFELKDGKPICIKHPGYTQQDCFYEANGSYSMFKTCNVWTGNCLSAAEVKIGIWTPLESGVVRHLE